MAHKQIGFGRVATDYAVFAYLMDRIILPEHSRIEVNSKELMKTIVNANVLKDCKTCMLKTADAHVFLTKGFGVTEST